MSNDCCMNNDSIGVVPLKVLNRLGFNVEHLTSSKCVHFINSDQPDSSKENKKVTNEARSQFQSKIKTFAIIQLIIEYIKNCNHSVSKKFFIIKNLDFKFF